MVPHPSHGRVPIAVVRRAQEAVASAGAVAAVVEERAERLVADRWEGAAGRLDEEVPIVAACAHTLLRQLAFQVPNP